MFCAAARYVTESGDINGERRVATTTRPAAQTATNPLNTIGDRNNRVVPRPRQRFILEATPGIEPGYTALQAVA